MINITKRKAALWLIAIVLIVATSGAAYYWYEEYGPNRMVSASISPYNHTESGIDTIFVNSIWGGNSYPHTGGGSGICCVMIPAKWRPGLVVNIKWHKDKEKDDVWHTAQVPIPEYSRSADIQVHFVKNDGVRVFITSYWPMYPAHPLHKEYMEDKL